jgi:hypothetical protein
MVEKVLKPIFARKYILIISFSISKKISFRVLIHLLDENDNAPIIDIYPYDIETDSNSIKLFINESIPIHSLILSFSVIDRDSGDNGRVTWKFDRLSLTPFELIRLTENTGELRTQHFLDREYISQYNLTLQANDHGRPVSKSTRLNIFIILLDINDNKPTFRENHMKSTINEHVKFNKQYGYEIFHLHAEDFDQDLNGEIVYSLIDNENNRFHIDSNTGIIRAMEEFDRKKQETFILHVEARDKGIDFFASVIVHKTSRPLNTCLTFKRNEDYVIKFSLGIPSLSSQGTVTFTVISRNEYSPTCDMNKNISWSIMENREFGTVVGVISCRDDDKDGPNGEMKVYSRWFPEEKTKYIIPFDIITKPSNISEVIISKTFVKNIK